MDVRFWTAVANEQLIFRDTTQWGPLKANRIFRGTFRTERVSTACYLLLVRFSFDLRFDLKMEVTLLNVAGSSLRNYVKPKTSFRNAVK
jgi:high-affinity nickel permease